jgi:hypothetical protein
MNRKDAIDKIVKYTSIFLQEVSSYNSIGSYDINIHSENTLIPILNAVFNVELFNANILKKNFPAVDLIDEVSRVAVQVTVTSSTDKIVSTLQKFTENALYNKFDVLYVVILAEKENSYKSKNISESVPDGFLFDTTKHIIDLNDIVRIISEIPSTEKILRIASLYETEFSLVQIRAREKKYKDGFLLNEPEDIYINLLDISFPQQLFIADIVFEEERLIENINQSRESKGKRKLKTFSKAKLFKNALKEKEIYDSEWILRENKIITFRDLHSSKEQLRSFVDKGTIEVLDSAEYYKTGNDQANNFKDLLRRCLIEYVWAREMEWIGERGIIRYRNNKELPNGKKLKWIGKKKSEKTVIFEMMSKKKDGEDQHIICYRNMAFFPVFYLIGNKWYLGINPTWSFTNPGGFYTSRFESSYLAGLKKKEQNNAVYYQFRFFAFQLSKTELFIPEYPFLSIKPLKPIEFIPKIVDKKWLPPKEFKPKNLKEAEVELDNELNLGFFNDEN